MNTLEKKVFSHMNMSLSMSHTLETILVINIDYNHKHLRHFKTKNFV